MKYILIALAVIAGASSESQAACPSNIAGTYSGYSLRSLGGAGGPVSDKGMRVKVMRLLKNGSGYVDKYFSIDTEEAKGLQERGAAEIEYVFDKKTCTVRIWKKSVGSSPADIALAISDSGKSMRGIAQSSTAGVFLHDANFYDFRKQ